MTTTDADQSAQTDTGQTLTDADRPLPRDSEQDGLPAYWFGMLAPLNVPTDDGRVLTAPLDRISVMPYPRPLLWLAWQDSPEHGGRETQASGGITVGAIDAAWIDQTTHGHQGLFASGRLDVGYLPPAFAEIVAATWRLRGFSAALPVGVDLIAEKVEAEHDDGAIRSDGAGLLQVQEFQLAGCSITQHPSWPYVGITFLTEPFDPAAYPDTPIQPLHVASPDPVTPRRADLLLQLGIAEDLLDGLPKDQTDADRDKRGFLTDVRHMLWCAAQGEQGAPLAVTDPTGMDHETLTFRIRELNLAIRALTRSSETPDPDANALLRDDRAALNYELYRRDRAVVMSEDEPARLVEQINDITEQIVGMQDGEQEETGERLRLQAERIALFRRLHELAPLTGDELEGMRREQERTDALLSRRPSPAQLPILLDQMTRLTLQIQIAEGR